MESKSVRAVERAIDILDVLRDRGRSVGISELSDELDLAKSTVHRLVIALSNKGMLRQDTESGKYSFGYKALHLGFSAVQHWDTISLAMPFLEELRDRTKETAALALKVGLQYTYVTQATSPHEYRVNPDLGRQYPLHWAATGKVILAHVRETELEQCLQVVPASRSTANTVTDPNLLIEQLEQIRLAGYAISFGERHSGSAAIAAPVLDRHRLALAAACIVGPVTRIQEQDLSALGETVAEVTRGIQIACQAAGIKC